MISLLTTKYFQLVIFINDQLTKICTPNPKYTPLLADRELHTIRNKVIFLSNLAITILFFLEIYTKGVPIGFVLKRSCATLSLLAALVLSCKYHPQMFYIPYTLLIAGYELLLVKSNDIHSAYACASLVPVLQYMLIERLDHFMIQAAIQLYFLNVFFDPKMEEAVMDMTPQAYTQALRQSNNLMLFINCAVIVPVQCFKTRIRERAWNTESRKNELEKQKVFLLSFSHELRNLINGLTGNVKLASLEDCLPDRVKELLLNAEVCGEVLLHLVNNILDTGKAEVGDLEVDPTSTKTYDSLERIWSICSELIGRKMLGGKMTILKSLPRTILVDQHRLTQIFLNIVNNAIKFTTEGSININIEWIYRHQEVNNECFKPHPYGDDDDDQDEGLFERSQAFNVLMDDRFKLDIRHKKINKENLNPPNTTNRGVLKISIADTGCGMSNEQTRELFQKFTQVTTDPSKRKLGTGLGLFISKQLCQKMGGDIRVFSKADKGSCFTFCLPIKVMTDRDDHLIDISNLKGRIIAKKLRAMIVDDVPFNSLILKDFLVKLGVEVMNISVNGLEAYSKYEEHTSRRNRPHIVTMDLEMPIMDGKEASRKIRNFEGRRQLNGCFLAIVSANSSESEIKECLNKEGTIRANVFLKKPLKIEELARAIEYHFLRE